MRRLFSVIPERAVSYFASRRGPFGGPGRPISPHSHAGVRPEPSPDGGTQSPFIEWTVSPFARFLDELGRRKDSLIGAE